MFSNSFHNRLVVGSALWISLGIAVSGFFVADRFHRLIVDQFEHDLVDHLAELATHVIVGADDMLTLRDEISDARFKPLRSGLYWQVWGNRHAIRSPSLGEENLPAGHRSPDTGAPYQTAGPTGPMRMIHRSLERSGADRPLLLAVGVDERLIDEATSEAWKSLFVSLAVLALGLIGAAYAQIRYGLHPLKDIHAGLAAVRSGQAELLPEAVPAELSPLVSDMNALLTTNREVIKRARLQAGNLAHALKTPLTILFDEVERLRAAGDAEAANVIQEQCNAILRQIDYQTARARAAVRNNPANITTIGPVVRGIIATLERAIHDRPVRFHVSGEETLLLACDPHDLGEMVGNMLDNACKFAASRIDVSIVSIGEIIRISIEDDGAGIPPEHRERVFGLGERLHERVPGSGIGLTITRDLAHLYDGRTWIDESPLGGVAACLELRAAAHAAGTPVNE